MIVHTSAIVFKSVDFRESSKIVTLFTEEHGKIAVIVRGVKKPKSKYSGLMEVGNLLDVVYYHKESRSVQVLTEASLLEKTLNLRLDFNKMATVTSAIELISQLLHEGEVNKPVFNMTKKFLLWMDQTEDKPHRIFPYLQIRLSELVGIGLQLHQDPSSERNSSYLNLETGLIASGQSTSHSYKLSQNQLNYVIHTLKGQGKEIFNIPFGDGELKELIQHLDRYLKYHVEGLKDRKSDAIFEQMLQE